MMSGGSFDQAKQDEPSGTITHFAGDTSRESTGFQEQLRQVAAQLAGCYTEAY
jgi:hypothetical protein